MEHAENNETSSVSPVESPGEPCPSTPKLRSGEKTASRREKRREYKKRQRNRKGTVLNVQEEENSSLLEDESAAWEECQAAGQVWGGRGKGGRGAYAGAVNSIRSNIHLANISLTLNNGTELLQNANMDIVKGRRYGLVGVSIHHEDFK